MTPPRRDALGDARRRLDEAAGALDDMRRLTGAAGTPGAPIASVSEGVRREALETARDDLRRMAADLEAARAEGALLREEVGRLREELAARPTARDLAEARAAGDCDAARRAAELVKQVAVLQERVALLRAEHVRLEALRRKAEAFGADESASRRSLEQTLRRDLLAAHAALDRAAAESGVRDAKAVTEIVEMRKRLDAALNRLHREDRENIRNAAADAAQSSFRDDCEAASAVIASLRRELSQQRADALGRESALGQRVHELERRLTEALSPQGAALLEEVGRLREELAARPAARDLKEAHAANEMLRSDLRAALAANAALGRDVAESGTREASAAAEIQELRKRLDSALGRLHLVDQDFKQVSGEAASLRGDLEAAQGAVAALRQELSQKRADGLGRERALAREAAESGTRESKALAEVEALRKRLDLADLSKAAGDAAQSSFRDELLAAQGVIASLRRELSEQRADAQGRERALAREAAESGTRESKALAEVEALRKRLDLADLGKAAAAGIELEYEVGEETVFEYPPMEYALEPGWARLLSFGKTPLQTDYGHLRRLSAGATIELALRDSPATTETASILPVLESALAAWDAVFRRRGIALTREVSRDMPDSPHDPGQLRLALHHVLRNAVEALPRGATLRVHLRKSATDAAEIEFRDDGPGYPLAWLERKFEPFASPRHGHAGLGLAAVRRALRRRGGDASASNAAAGRGAVLILTFAAAPARPEAKPRA